MRRALLIDISLGVRIVNRGFRTSAVAWGGARPGGAPTFNWKQKKLLGLDKPAPEEVVKLESFGELEELMNDERYKGGVFEDIPDDGVFEINGPKLKEPNPQRKKIQIRMLFGAAKPAGPASVVKKKERFSHRRVFGHKGNRAIESPTI